MAALFAVHKTLQLHETTVGRISILSQITAMGEWRKRALGDLGMRQAGWLAGE